MAFNGRFVLNLIKFAAEKGVDQATLIAKSGKTELDLLDENCTIDSARYDAIITYAVEKSRDPFLGLHASESMSLSAAGLIGQITQTSKTVKQALDYCCAFANLGCSSLPMHLVHQAKEFKLVITPNSIWLKTSPKVVRQTADGVLAFTIREFSNLSLHKHQPKKVYVTWPQPEQSMEYNRVLACPVYYNQNEIAIFLDEEHINEKIVTANYSLLRILVKHAEEMSALKERNTFSELTKQTIVRLMQPVFPTINEVASHLNHSVRTFQRKLKTENKVYKELLDEVKKEFAISYLKNKKLSISDAAYLLGYNDLSAFNRSCKRWIGTSPRQYRAQPN